ncbi:MAG: hypothetical protein WCI22_09420 [Actinomycetota bacterium]
MGTSKLNGWFTGRNRWLTLGSIAAVGITGAIAVGANIGILNAANSTKVGKVDTAAQLTAPASTAPNTSVVDVYVTDTAASTTAAANGQVFTVDVAGTVTLDKSTSGLHLVDVAPAAGWMWSLNQPSAGELTVTLKNGVRTLEFHAVLAANGTIQANVNEPVVQQAPSNGGTPTPNVGGNNGDSGDDHYEGGGSDD